MDLRNRKRTASNQEDQEEGEMDSRSTGEQRSGAEVHSQIGGDEDRVEDSNLEIGQEDVPQEVVRGSGTGDNVIMQMLMRIDANARKDREEKKKDKEEIKSCFTRMEKINEELKQDLNQNMEKLNQKIEQMVEECRAECKKKNEEIIQEVNRIGKISEDLETRICEIAVEISKRDEKTDQLQSIMGKNVEEIGQRLSTQEGLIAKLLENGSQNSERELRMLDQKLKDQRAEMNRIREEMEKGRITETRIVTVGQGYMSQHSFDGDIKKMHPKVFLKALQNRVKNIHNNQEVKEIIREKLIGNALIWFSTKENKVNDFPQFEQAFLKYYWGEDVQRSIKEKLYTARFDHYKGGSMNDYAMSLFAIAQHLDPRMEEEEIVRQISRQFKSVIADFLSVNNIITMDQLSNYLRKVETDKTNYETRRNTYGGNNQNNNMGTVNRNSNYNQENRGNNNYNNNFRRFGNYGENRNYFNRRDNNEYNNRREFGNSDNGNYRGNNPNFNYQRMGPQVQIRNTNENGNRGRQENTMGRKNFNEEGVREQGNEQNRRVNYQRFEENRTRSRSEDGNQRQGENEQQNQVGFQPNSLTEQDF